MRSPLTETLFSPPPCLFPSPSLRLSSPAQPSLANLAHTLESHLSRHGDILLIATCPRKGSTLLCIYSISPQHHTGN